MLGDGPPLGADVVDVEDIPDAHPSKESATASDAMPRYIVRRAVAGSGKNESRFT